MLHAADGLMHSAHLVIAVPSVVRLRRFVRVPYRWNTPLNRRSVFARDGHRCQYCNGPAESIDHVVPRSRGGGHPWDNVVASPPVQRAQTGPHAGGDLDAAPPAAP